MQQGQFVGLKVRVESGFVNDKVPTKFNHNGIHVCLLAETSDGRKLHFGRISLVTSHLLTIFDANDL